MILNMYHSPYLKGFSYLLYVCEGSAKHFRLMNMLYLAASTVIKNEEISRVAKTYGNFF